MNILHCRPASLTPNIGKYRTEPISGDYNLRRKAVPLSRRELPYVERATFSAMLEAVLECARITTGIPISSDAKATIVRSRPSSGRIRILINIGFKLTSWCKIDALLISPDPGSIPIKLCQLHTNGLPGAGFQYVSS
jgi:hypothetical protein